MKDFALYTLQFRWFTGYAAWDAYVCLSSRCLMKQSAISYIGNSEKGMFMRLPMRCSTSYVALLAMWTDFFLYLKTSVRKKLENTKEKRFSCCE